MCLWKPYPGRGLFLRSPRSPGPTQAPETQLGDKAPAFVSPGRILHLAQTASRGRGASDLETPTGPPPHTGTYMWKSRCTQRG